MILVVGPYANSENEKDGFVQRIVAVDNSFKGVDRVYLDVKCRRNLMPRFSRPHPNVRVWEINSFLHFALILYFSLRATGIHVHSVYYAKHVLPMYLWKRVVTEMHGIVPEEMSIEGRRFNAWFYDLVEGFAMRNSYLVLAVTEAMANHLRSKHRRCCTRMLVVPNFDDTPFAQRNGGRNGDRLTVIYSGGAHIWQNVDAMLDAISRVRDHFEFVILTRDMGIFHDKLEKAGLDGSVRLATVPKTEVGEFYSQADLGFVLREDNIVNRVACPTKIIEYLAYGIIPIVLQPQIGDFAEYGYSYILLSDFLAGNLPAASTMQSMRARNYEVLQRMKDAAPARLACLVTLLTGRDDGGMTDSTSRLDG